MSRSATSRIAALLVGLIAFACAPPSPPSSSGASHELASKPVVIGSKAFTESVILGEMLRAGLTSRGVAASHRKELGGSSVLLAALRQGSIDVYPEYVGTLQRALLPSSSTEALTAHLAAKGLSMGPSLGFQNGYALAMRAEHARALGIRSLSDLQAQEGLRAAFSGEFMERADGWPGLAATYGLEHWRPRVVGHAIAYAGIAEGNVDVIDVYSTDGEIAMRDLLVLEDDRGFFPDYAAVFLWRTDRGASQPALPAVMEAWDGVLSSRDLMQANRAVLVEKRSEREVGARLHRKVEAHLAGEISPGTQDPFTATSRAARHRAVGKSPDSRLDEAVSVAPFSTARLLQDLWRHTKDHLRLVGLALLLIVMCALPLGIVAAKSPRLGQLILSTVGILQTIPSLALLVLMIPLVGIGLWPAVLALFLYGLLPIVRNTHAGLTGIPDATRDAALALGLTPWARLWRVELPLAAPSVLAGIQTSAVITVGTATLGALIGSGGYGEPILSGIRLNDTWRMLEGAIPSALLAIAVQWFFDALGVLVVPRKLRGERGMRVGASLG